MRLPFWFRRRSGSDDAAAPGADVQTAPAESAAPRPLPSGGAIQRPVTPVPYRAWADLPPIQRAASQMPLVAAPRGFVQRLPGAAGLPPIVQPLGHDVSPAAAPGLIVARAANAQAAPSSALPLRAYIQGLAEAAEPIAAAPRAPIVARASKLGGDAAAHAEPTAPAGAESVAIAPRQLPTIGSTDVRLPDTPLTAAPAAPMPVAQRMAAGASGIAPGTPPSIGMRRAPAGAHAMAPATGQPVADVPATASTASPPKLVARFATTRASVPAERTGLGAPLPNLPPTARPLGERRTNEPVGRPDAFETAMAIVQRTRRVASTEPLTGTAAASAALSDTSSVSKQAAPRLPHLPLAQVTRPAPSVHGAARGAPAPRPATRPTVGRTPIQPVPPLQRTGRSEMEPAGALPQPWWGAAPASAPPAIDRAVSIGLPDGGRDGILSGVTTASHLTSASDATRTPTSIQRAVTRATPGLRVSEELPLLGREATGLARAAGADAGAGTGQSRPVEVLTTPMPSSGVAVQASRSTPSTSAAAALPSIVGTPVVQRIDGAAPDAEPEAETERSEDELETLAEALFGRIRGRLRNDLLHDREAKGLAFDHI